MITVEQVRKLLSVTKKIEPHVIKIDAMLMVKASRGWTPLGCIRYFLDEDDFEVAQAIAIAYREAGWTTHAANASADHGADHYVDIDLPSLDR